MTWWQFTIAQLALLTWHSVWIGIGVLHWRTLREGLRERSGLIVVGLMFVQLAAWMAFGGLWVNAMLLGQYFSAK